MKTETTGTLISGAVQLDKPVNLPDQCRVNISIEPIDEHADAGTAQAALERFLTRAASRTFDSGGKRYSRDELHERG